MKRKKEIFQEVRKTLGNHLDKAIVKYWEYQNADKKQIEHASGNQQQWK
jgi:hypothetical protein